MTEQVAYNSDMTEETVEIFGPPSPEELLPIPEEAGYWMFEVYWSVLDWLLPFMMAIGGYIVLRHLIWNSLRFNYYHYLKYGEFVILWGDDSNSHKKREQRLEISKKLEIESDFASWSAALVMSIAVFIIHIVVGVLWPISMIFVMPLGIVRLIGYRKRKKIEFKQKLKGEHLET